MKRMYTFLLAASMAALLSICQSVSPQRGNDSAGNIPKEEVEQTDIETIQVEEGEVAVGSDKDNLSGTHAGTDKRSMGLSALWIFGGSEIQCFLSESWWLEQ